MKRLAILLVRNNPSGLWIVLLTKLMVHPSAFIFVDRVTYYDSCLYLEASIYIYLESGDGA